MEMTKQKILLITSMSEKTVAWQERERYIREFCQSVQTAAGDLEVNYTTYADISYLVVDGKTTIYDHRTGTDVAAYDFVQFKNWQYELHEAPVIARYLADRQVPFLNSEVNILFAPGKLMQMVVLAGQGLPVPDTFYAPRQHMLSLITGGKLPDAFHYPLIIKANDGSKGDDNHLVRTAEEAIEILRASHKDYVIQNLIPNDGDYRVLFIGPDDQKPLVFLRQGVAGSHLNNTSKGGSGTFIGHEALPEGYVDLAKRASMCLGREIGGVDILVDKRTNRPYILEVNGTPAMATGYGQGEKVQKFTRFLQEVVAKNSGLEK